MSLMGDISSTMQMHLTAPPPSNEGFCVQYNGHLQNNLHKLSQQ